MDALAPYAVLALLIPVAVAYVAGAMLVARFLAPRRTVGSRAQQPIECGVEPTGDARMRLKVGFYLFALVFLVFDIEVLLLFPAVTALAAGAGPMLPALLALLLFVAVLFLALIFAWRKRVLEWR